MGNYSLFFNETMPGKIIISLFSHNYINHISEILLNIIFDSIEFHNEQISIITLDKFEVNGSNGNGGFLSTGNHNSVTSNSIQVNFTSTPVEYALNKNYPNPFNPSTVISFDIAYESNVNLLVYDIKGRLVATLVKGVMEIGSYDINYDASSLSSGMYFVVLNAADINSTESYKAVQKIVLLK